MTRRIPLGITADLHLDEFSAFASVIGGFNSRLIWGERVVLYMAEKTAKAGGRTLIVVGDWFHNRRRISVNTLFVSERCIRACRERFRIGIVCVLGNHDLSFDGNANSIKGQPFDRVIDKPGHYEVDGWKLGVVPWTDDPKTIHPVLNRPADLYLGHLGVSGARVGPSDFEIQGHIDATHVACKSPFLLGHYHKPQVIPNTRAQYIGSPLQLSWGETKEDKRFILASESGLDSVPLRDFPKFVRVPENQLSKCRDIDYVEVRVKDAKSVQRVRNNLRESRPTAAIVVDDVEVSKVPRVDMSGRGVREQLEAYTKYAKLPRGVSNKDALKVALEILGGGT